MIEITPGFYLNPNNVNSIRVVRDLGAAGGISGMVAAVPPSDRVIFSFADGSEQSFDAIELGGPIEDIVSEIGRPSATARRVYDLTKQLEETGKDLVGQLELVRRTIANGQ